MVLTPGQQFNTFGFTLPASTIPSAINGFAAGGGTTRGPELPPTPPTGIDIGKILDVVPDAFKEQVLSGLGLGGGLSEAATASLIEAAGLGGVAGTTGATALGSGVQFGAPLAIETGFTSTLGASIGADAGAAATTAATELAVGTGGVTGALSGLASAIGALGPAMLVAQGLSLLNKSSAKEISTTHTIGDTGLITGDTKNLRVPQEFSTITIDKILPELTAMVDDLRANNVDLTGFNFATGFQGADRGSAGQAALVSKFAASPQDSEDILNEFNSAMTRLSRDRVLAANKERVLARGNPQIGLTRSGELEPGVGFLEVTGPQGLTKRFSFINLDPELAEAAPRTAELAERSKQEALEMSRRFLQGENVPATFEGRASTLTGTTTAGETPFVQEIKRRQEQRGVRRSAEGVPTVARGGTSFGDFVRSLRQPATTTTTQGLPRAPATEQVAPSPRRPIEQPAPRPDDDDFDITVAS